MGHRHRLGIQGVELQNTVSLFSIQMSKHYRNLSGGLPEKNILSMFRRKLCRVQSDCLAVYILGCTVVASRDCGVLLVESQAVGCRVQAVGCIQSIHGTDAADSTEDATIDAQARPPLSGLI